MSIKFDEIHTAKKQKLLSMMMLRAAETVRGIENDNPVLDTCPICASEQVSLFVNAYGFDMSICADCGLIFCNPYPSETQLMRYYNSEMKAFENEFFSDSFEKRINIFLPRIALMQRLKKHGTLLDVGSAIGIFIEALVRQKTNYEITCCDMSVEACAELRSRHSHVDVINMDVKEIPENKKYDIVTMWDTIEHIVHLDELLVKLRKLLKKDSLLFLSTPNTNSFEWKIAGDKHVQILPPGHVNLMNEKCLGILLQKNGFVVTETHTLNPSLDISYVRKLVETGSVDPCRIGTFLKEAILEEDFEEILSEYLIKKRQAGNFLVVAQMDTGSKFPSPKGRDSSRNRARPSRQSPN